MHEDQKKALLKGLFLLAPADTEPYEANVSGQAHRQVGVALVGALLGQAVSSVASDDDRIRAAILKVFWEWDRDWLMQFI
jgi:hypothetical protein